MQEPSQEHETAIARLRRLVREEHEREQQRREVEAALVAAAAQGELTAEAKELARLRPVTEAFCAVMRANGCPGTVRRNLSGHVLQPGLFRANRKYVSGPSIDVWLVAEDIRDGDRGSSWSANRLWMDVEGNFYHDYGDLKRCNDVYELHRVDESTFARIMVRNNVTP